MKRYPKPDKPGRILMILLFCCMAFQFRAQESNTLYVPDLVGIEGRSLTIPVELTNTNPDITAMQFRIALPTEVLECSAAEIKLTDRTGDHRLHTSEYEPGKFLIMVYSPTNSRLTANSGAVVTLTCVPKNQNQTTIDTEYPINLLDVVLSDRDSKNVLSMAQGGVFRFQDSADFLPYNVKTSATVLNPGDPFNITFSIKNIGGTDTQKWTEQIYLESESGEICKLQTIEPGIESILSGNTLEREIELTLPQLPAIEGKVNVCVKILPASEGSEALAYRDNNTASTDSYPISVEKRLLFSVPAKTLQESDRGSVKCKVTRSGSWKESLTFPITISPEDSRLIVPETVTIAPKQGTAYFIIKIQDNEEIDGNTDVSINIEGNGYPAVSAPITIIDDEKPELTLSAEVDKVTEGESFTLTIEREGRWNDAIDVTLKCDLPGRFEYPSAIHFEAGEKTKTVEIKAIDNDVLELEALPMFTASAEGHESDTFALTLLDNDAPTLELILTPATVAEDAGLMGVKALLRRTSSADTSIKVQLNDDSEGSIYHHQKSVTLAKGVTEIEFPIGIVDDSDNQGDRTVNLSATVYVSSCNCSLPTGSIGSATAPLEIIDNDGPALSLTASKATLFEGDAHGITLTVRRNTPPTEDLEASISSDADDFISYPKSVVIPAGEESAQITVTAPSNETTGDDRTISFTATGGNFSKGCCWVMLSDRTLPDASVSDLSVNEKEVYKGDTMKVELCIANEGTAVLPEATKTDIYAGGVKKGSVYTTRALDRGETETLECEIPADSKIGICKLYASINDERRVKETNYYNNRSNETTVNILTPYQVSVATDKTSYKPGETVNISGTVTGKNIAEQPVEVFILQDGLRQPLAATSDTEGHFSLTFTPYANQTGDFSIGACYPGEESKAATSSFCIFGLERVNKDYIKKEINVNGTATGSFKIRNTGSLSLNGLTATVQEAPEDCEVTVSTDSGLTAKAEAEVQFNITPRSLTEGSKYQVVRLNITSEEGANLEIPVYYYCLYPKGKLQSELKTLKTKMVKGATKEYPLTIANLGAGETGEITFSGPSWMSLSHAALPSLNPNESVQIILRLTPSEDFQLNNIHTGTIAFNCENGSGFALPYSIETVSETTGTLVVDATDEFTYYTEEAPHLEGAKVLVQHPVTDAKIAQGITDSDGLFTVQLPEGYYKLTVSADKHKSYSNYVLVEPGEEPTYEVADLSYQATTMKFEVEETEESDEYEIIIKTEFETNVPVPVVIIEGPEKLGGDDMADGESKLLLYTLTNHGLITASSNVFTIPEDSPEWTWEALVDLEPFDLLPQQSVVIPVKVTRHIVAPENSPERLPSNMTDAYRMCMEMMRDDYKHKCNKDWKDNTAYKKLAMKFCADGALASGILDALSGMMGGFGGKGGSGGAPNYYDPNSTSTSEEHEPTPINKDRTICNPCWAEYLDKNYDRPFGALPGGDYFVKGRNAAADMALGNSAPSKDPQTGSAKSVPNNIKRGIADIGMAILPEPVKGLVQPIVDMGKDELDYKECLEKLNKDKPGGDDEDSEDTDFELSPRKKRTPQSWVTEYHNIAALLLSQYEHYIAGMTEYFGDEDWLNNDDPTIREFMQKFGEMEEWTVENCLPYKPASITVGQLEAFVERMNNTVEGSGDNICDLDILTTELLATGEADEVAAGKGYETMTDYYLDERDIFNKNVEETSSAVCASVGIAIEQKITMTRQGFRGYLTIFNGDDLAPMENLILNLEVKNTETGKSVTSHEMQIDLIDLDTFEGNEELGAGWSLAPQSTGKATVRFIPSKYAAPEVPVDYSFGGTVSYIDPVTRYQVSEKLMPVIKTVNPSPILDLTYFMQRDIYGDDPLTEEIEDSETAEMALVMHNKGYGDATNVRVVTQQPVIVDNEKGLLLDMSIVGAGLNGKDYPMVLGSEIPVEVGTIPTKQSALLQWWIQSSLLGHFSNYSVEYNHASSYGNEDLSLIDEVSIHELMRGFTVGTEGETYLRGFLANDVEDRNNLPDAVYFSDGTVISNISTDADMDMTYESDGQYVVTINPQQEGWNYSFTPDRTGGKMKLISAKRISDNMEIPIDNFWQTSVTIPDGKDPVHEYMLHAVANIDDSESYLLTFEPKPDMELDVVGMKLIYDEIEEIPYVSRIEVSFNKDLDPSTFTNEDLVLFLDGELCATEKVEINPISDSLYDVYLSELATKGGAYEMKILGGGVKDKDGYPTKLNRSVCWLQLLGNSTGIHSVDNGKNVYIYPLPIESGFYVGGNFDGSFDIDIFDTLGNITYSSTELSKDSWIEVGDWTPGVYIIHVRNQQSDYILKTVKK